MKPPANAVSTSRTGDLVTVLFSVEVNREVFSSVCRNSVAFYILNITDAAQPLTISFAELPWPVDTESVVATFDNGVLCIRANAA